MRMSLGVFLFTLAMACKGPKTALVAAESRSIPVTQTAPADSGAWYFIQPWRDSVNKTMNSIVGVSDTAYFPGLPGGNLNNLVADMVMAAAKQKLLDQHGFMPHLCILNRGGLRNTLPKGTITSRDIFEMMPFENDLILLKIQGNTMDSVLNRIAAIGGAAVNGLKMEIHGKTYKNARIGGFAYDSRREYWLATSDYLANGGDGFEMLKNARERINTTIKLRDVVSSGIQREIKTEGRLLFHNDTRIVVAN